MSKSKEFLKQNWVLILSLIYIISPIDLIPGDIATGIGLIDDIAVLAGTGVYAFIRFLIEEKKRGRKEEIDR
jgi:uncharacterized membrane protein YkvA (DUF1232 family)